MIEDYKDFESLIENIKRKKEVVGILEYGGRSYSNMNKGGDYDFTVILDHKLSENFNGIHFHINGIPTDCMILAIEDFLTKEPSNDFYLVHLDVSILYDRDGKTKELLERINKNWIPSKCISDFEVHLFRFTFQHILDKLEHRLYLNPLYSKYFIYASFDWYLECYARINHLSIGQGKKHLNHIKLHDKEMYEWIESLYDSTSLDEMFKNLSKCAKRIIEPIGGLWRKDETLLHLLAGGQVILEESQAVISLLFD